MINKHGVDVSKIHVGDYVEQELAMGELNLVEDITDDGIPWDFEVDGEISKYTIYFDDIEFHYARQPREERG